MLNMRHAVPLGTAWVMSLITSSLAALASLVLENAVFKGYLCIRILPTVSWSIVYNAKIMHEGLSKQSMNRRIMND